MSDPIGAIILTVVRIQPRTPPEATLFFEALGALIPIMLLLSVSMTLTGLVTRSWWRLLAAATGSLVVTVFSFGLWTFALLVACVQIAAALAFRWSAGWRGWLALMTAALLAWALAVPLSFSLQTARPVPASIAFAMVMLGYAAVIAGPRRLRSITSRQNVNW